jgi:CHASE3 domain sensor protein
MTRGVRSIIALVLSVLAIAGVVLYASESQRKVADENYHEAIVAKQLGADMLARENALSDYLATGRTEELVLMYEADRRLDSNLRHAEDLSSDSPEELGTLKAQEAAEDSWDAVAKLAIDAKQADDTPPGSKKSAYREGLVDSFVHANRDYQHLLDEARVEELKAAALVPVKLILLVSVLLGAISFAVSLRRRRALHARLADKKAADEAERNYAQGQARFGEAMQVAENQAEGHDILTRHLERGIPDAAITVLIRNNSADRLEPALPLGEDSPLAEPLEQAKPRSCLAVRLSRPVDQGPNTSEIVTCDVCGAQPGESTCQPLLVGGEVIGSGAEHGRARAHRRRAPPHPGLRHPGRPGAREPPQPRAGRAARRDRRADRPPEPPRDRRPPQAPDGRRRALADPDVGDPARPRPLQADQRHLRPRARRRGARALGALMRSELRGSDFAGRSGGEEFIVMLPDTDRAGALRVAEHLRQACTRCQSPASPARSPRASASRPTRTTRSTARR